MLMLTRRKCIYLYAKNAFRPLRQVPFGELPLSFARTRVSGTTANCAGNPASAREEALARRGWNSGPCEGRPAASCNSNFCLDSELSWITLHRSLFLSGMIIVYFILCFSYRSSFSQLFIFILDIICVGD